MNAFVSSSSTDAQGDKMDDRRFLRLTLKRQPAPTGTAGTGGIQSGKPPRLSDDPLFRVIAWAFRNEDMTDAEQMKAFAALRKAGVLK